MATTPADLAMWARQAIVTRYLGPTNHRGSRIKAVCDARSLTVAWDHALSATVNHAAAATQLFTAMGWHEHNDLVMGGLPSALKESYVFVQVPKYGIEHPVKRGTRG